MFHSHCVQTCFTVNVFTHVAQSLCSNMLRRPTVLKHVSQSLCSHMLHSHCVHTCCTVTVFKHATQAYCVQTCFTVTVLTHVTQSLCSHMLHRTAAASDSRAEPQLTASAICSKLRTVHGTPSRLRIVGLVVNPENANKGGRGTE